jgi:acyl dehydratase
MSHRLSTDSKCWPSPHREPPCSHFIGEVFISFLEQSCTFLAEVHSGDTLYPALTITGFEPKGDDGIVVTAVTVHNQRRQLVLSGQHKYLLRRLRAIRNGDG